MVDAEAVEKDDGSSGTDLVNEHPQSVQGRSDTDRPSGREQCAPAPPANLRSTDRMTASLVPGAGPFSWRCR